MTSTETSRKRGKGEACTRCRKLKKGCVSYDSSTCIKCHEDGIVCGPQGSRKTLATKGKRKNEELNNTSDSESVQTKRAISSATMSHNSHDIPITRNASQLQPRSLRSSRPDSKNRNRAISEVCGICQVGHRASKSTADTVMVLCEIKTCSSWYHLSCICCSEDSRHMLFSPASSLEDAIFICPKCYDQPTEAYTKVALQAVGDFMTTISNERRKNNASSQDVCPESSIPVHSSQKHDNPQILVQEVEDLGLDLRQANATDFDLAREEKFQGFDKNEVDGLIRNLHDSIYDYSLEVWDAIDVFDHDDVCIKKPLAEWTLIDPRASTVKGEPWYRIDGSSKNQIRSHLPITAALRSMLQIPDDKPLEINSRLSNLTFSQVHTGFVGWFIIDVLDNELDIYSLPNMKPMRAMMSAVKQSVEARWPKIGSQFLREVQLRTWYKEPFQNSMLLHEGEMLRRMEAFLEPLTKDFEKISRWSHAGTSIIGNTLKLWSYLQSLGGKLVVIRPVIGSFFDPQLHEESDEGCIQQNQGKHAKKKILWILRRGFRCEEDGVDGPRELTIKALVIAQ